MRILLAGVLALALPACLVGTGDITSGPGGTDPGGDPGGNPGGDPGGNPGGDQGGNPTATPKVSATVDKMAVSTELGKTETLGVTLTGSDGFAGDVTVTPTIVDAQGNPVTGYTLSPVTTTLTQDGTATASIDVAIPTDAAVLDPTIKLAVTSSAAEVDLSSTFTIAKQVTINFDAGTGNGAPHTSLGMPNSRLNIRAGTKIIFHNGDTIAHRIHGDGGIQHEGGDLAPGADYTVTVSSNADWYCHDHESANADARIVNIVQ
jgi:hypothetical protein